MIFLEHSFIDGPLPHGGAPWNQSVSLFFLNAHFPVGLNGLFHQYLTAFNVAVAVDQMHILPPVEFLKLLAVPGLLSAHSRYFWRSLGHPSG